MTMERSEADFSLHGKVELTLPVETVAKNPYWPYALDVPNGIRPGTGVSVDVEFTPDDWATIYTVPAFY